LRILILAIGTLGDVRPYIALGLGLKKAGFSVCLASHQNFQKLVTEHGLEFATIGYTQELMTGQEMLRLSEVGGNFASWMRQLSRFTWPIMEGFLRDCWQACQGAGAIIYSPFGWAGYHIAQRLNVPCYAACLQPISRTRSFPTVWSPTWLRPGGYYNWLTHLMIEQVFWQVFRKATNRWRQNILNLPPLPLAGPFGAPSWKHQPFLYGFSPAVVPKPPDWPEWCHVTGFWFLEPNPEWKPPEKLADFLDCGPTPVYVGFGSVPAPDPEMLTELVAQALANSGKRGILQIARTESGVCRLSDDVLQVGWVPHDWLFPRTAAVVHHGGASTTATGLLAGVPAVIVPFAWDQPFWGQRIAGLGVGPPPIPRHKLSSKRLAAAIKTATTDRGMEIRAQTLGKRIQGEDGVGQAANILTRNLVQH
jgi:sterol 3beta-glucosyltransferase